jgi:Lipoprotein LpqB beta-propeller domain/Sporulation and spore germination
MRARSLRVAGVAGLGVLLLLSGCISIPTGGGVTTTQVDVSGDDPLPSRPSSPTKDASPEEIIAGFLSAGRGPQQNYSVAREYLTADFHSTWQPTARILISSTPVSPQSLADNTWSVSVSATATLDDQGRYETAAPAEQYDLTFGLVKNADGQWRINSAPDGTVLPPSRFASIFTSYEIYFFDPTFDYLVPDLRWFRKGTTAATSVVDALLAGPSDRLGDGALFSAFPAGTTRDGGKVDITAGTAVVALTADVNAGSTTTHRRMQQQLLQTLRSVTSIRKVDITVNKFTLQIPDGGSPPDSSYLVGNDPVGGFDGNVGVLGEDGVTAISGIGRSADDVGATGGSIVSHDRDALALLSDAGVSIVRAGEAPKVIDDRSRLIAPSLDQLGFTWTVRSDSPSSLQAIGDDGTAHDVTGLTSDGRVISIDVSRDGARLLVALQTAGGPRLVVAGIQRDADLVPTGLVTPLDLPIGTAELLDAAWIDGVTVVALTDGPLTAVDAYEIGGQHTSMGTLEGGRVIVGGNSLDGTRVLDQGGHVQRPGGGTSWQDTGIVASFLVTQQ